MLGGAKTIILAFGVLCMAGVIIIICSVGPSVARTTEVLNELRARGDHALDTGNFDAAALAYSQVVWTYYKGAHQTYEACDLTQLARAERGLADPAAELAVLRTLIRDDGAYQLGKPYKIDHDKRLTADKQACIFGGADRLAELASESPPAARTMDLVLRRGHGDQPVARPPGKLVMFWSYAFWAFLIGGAIYYFRHSRTERFRAAQSRDAMAANLVLQAKAAMASHAEKPPPGPSAPQPLPPQHDAV